MMQKSWIVAGVAMAAVVVLSGCSAAAVTPRPASATMPFEITGYAETGATSYAQLKASNKAMTMVGVDGVNLTSDGDGISAVDPASLTLLHQAHKLGNSSELLFGNFDSGIGDFSKALAEKMFDSDANIDAVASDLADEVTKDGWDGITVDLESLNDFGDPAHNRDDNAGLVKFVTALRAKLDSAKTISICLVATTDSYADYGYDLGEISAQVDHVVLMAYDQHGPSWSNAGPVGGYPWVTKSVKLLAKGVPAAQIQLGIAGYGYSWKHGKEQDNGPVYSDKAARAKVKAEHVTAHWSSTQREWHATFRSGTVIWWSDARSYRARLALAHSLKLGGVAVWSLGQSDPLK